jgi:hypothetical protein
MLQAAGRVAIFTVLLVATACKDRSARPEPTLPPGPPHAQPANATDEFNAYGTAPREVELVSSGGEPRRVLAYAMSGGPREARVALASGSRHAGKELMSIALDATLQWSRGGASGDRERYELEFRDAQATRDPTMSDDEWGVVRSIHQAFGRVAGRARIGRHGDLDLAQTRGLTTQPSWLYLLHLAVVPLPVDPVGAGARWRTRQPLTADDGTAGIEDRTYELIAFDGDTLTVQLSGRGVYTPDTAGSANPRAPEQVTLAFTGELAIDLADPLPRSAALGVEQRMHIPAPAGAPEVVGVVRFAIDR